MLQPSDGSMNIRIYVCKNAGLPRVEQSFKYIEKRLACSGLKDCNLQIIEASQDIYEFKALDACWLDSQELDFYGLYLHCKGASKENEVEFNNCIAWLDYMLYGLVDNHELCLDHLNKGADLVGSMWYRHFKGNCFWFKSSYVKPLIRPMLLNLNNRYLAEYWCSQSHWFNPQIKIPRVKSLFYMPIDKDSDFLRLKENDYVPDFNHRYVCENFEAMLAQDKTDYSVFDELVLTNEELHKHKDVLTKYLNYDGKISLK
jgi:hypothetical protein